jgi:membrane-associated phospholipid phosphatase
VTARLKAIQTWGVAATATAIAVAVSVAFLDRPIAWFSYDAVGHLLIVREFAGTPSLFGPLEIFVFLMFLVRRIALYPLGYADAVLALCEVSLLATTLILSPMKVLFGRTWPLHGHPSFLIDGAYGFHFFTAGPQFRAFPSGHMASVCALAGVLWATYPRLRSFYAGGAAAMAAALVAGDFHFLSDVLAGGFLGATVAFLILGAWDFVRTKFLFAYPLRPSSKPDKSTGRGRRRDATLNDQTWLPPCEEQTGDG